MASRLHFRVSSLLWIAVVLAMALGWRVDRQLLKDRHTAAIHEQLVQMRNMALKTDEALTRQNQLADLLRDTQESQRLAPR